MLATNKPKTAYFAELDELQHDLQTRLHEHYRHTAFSQLVAGKVANLLAADYHFRNGHAWLSSRPVELTIDPSNGCQLRCPGCVHSSNPDWSTLFDWPRRSMKYDLFKQFMDIHAPFASAAIFYNYGEPFLNKNLPQMIKLAKEYLLFTMASSNLSLEIDAEAIVCSGLDRLIVSVDGATQASYERYRRRGQLDKVLLNIAELTKTKKVLGMKRPYICWQYLVFEHNQHEIQKAIATARALGVDEISITEPFAVDADDPSIRAVKLSHPKHIVFHNARVFRFSVDDLHGLSRHAGNIDSAVQEKWLERCRNIGKPDEEHHQNARACHWLYHNITIDGASRVMPCCIAPTKDKGDKNLVYASFESPDTELINSPDAVLSRLSHSDHEGFEQQYSKSNDGYEPYCTRCEAKPQTPNDIAPAAYISSLDFDRVIPDVVYRRLSEADLYRR